MLSYEVNEIKFNSSVTFEKALLSSPPNGDVVSRAFFHFPASFLAKKPKSCVFVLTLGQQKSHQSGVAFFFTADMPDSSGVTTLQLLGFSF